MEKTLPGSKLHYHTLKALLSSLAQISYLSSWVHVGLLLGLICISPLSLPRIQDPDWWIKWRYSEDQQAASFISLKGRTLISVILPGMQYYFWFTTLARLMIPLQCLLPHKPKKQVWCSTKCMMCPFHLHNGPKICPVHRCTNPMNLLWTRLLRIPLLSGSCNSSV